MNGPERRTFQLNGREYSGFLNVMDVGTLENMNSCQTTVDLLKRAMSIGGAASIIQLACKNVAKRMDAKAFKDDFEAEARKGGLISISNIAGELLQDTGLFDQEDGEEKKT